MRQLRDGKRGIVAGFFLFILSPSARLFAADTAPPGELTIKILDGDDAINNSRLRVSTDPIIAVEDQHHNRVPGAVVVFLLPARGAGLVSANGSNMLTVTTDAEGKAVLSGLRPNSLSGKFEIRVSASYQGQAGHAVMHMENRIEPSIGHVPAKWVVVAAAVAGGVAVGVLSTRNSPKPAQPAQSATLTPVTGTVGGP